MGCRLRENLSDSEEQARRLQKREVTDVVIVGKSFIHQECDQAACFYQSLRTEHKNKVGEVVRISHDSLGTVCAYPPLREEII